LKDGAPRGEAEMTKTRRAVLLSIRYFRGNLLLRRLIHDKNWNTANS
jgi:hypothetical protein